MEEESENSGSPPQSRKEVAHMAGKTEYKNNWQKENVDRVNLTMSKGRKDAIKAHAATRGESVNGFINRAITETMERDNGTPAASEGEE